MDGFKYKEIIPQHIPVHVMSGMKQERKKKEMGAFDFLVKPLP
jgi:hypothetical protein